MIETLNFNPQQNYVIAASTASAPKTITQPANTAAGQNPLSNVMVSNNTSSVAYLAWAATGTATATASGLNSVAVMPGAIEVFNMGISAASIAAVLESGTGNVFISVGQGS